MADIILPLLESDFLHTSIRGKVHYNLASLQRNYKAPHPLIIAVYISRTPILVYVIEACFRLGIAYVPIDKNLPKNRANYIISDCGAQYIITDSKIDFDIGQARELSINDFIDITDQSLTYGDIIGAKVSEEELAYIMYTSGTTGFPKGVLISRRAINNFIHGEAAIIDFSKHELMVATASVSFDIFFGETILPLMLGTSVLFLNDSESQNVALLSKSIARHKADIIQLTPSRMKLILEYCDSLNLLKSIKTFMIGGEDFSLQLLKRLQSKTNATIFNMYGPTETAICVTIANLTNESTVHIGRPINNTEIMICNELLERLPNGVVGEICLIGKSLGDGYNRKTEKSNESFVVSTKYNLRVYRTGDLGFINMDGNLVFRGRKDFQVKLNGYRIELEEIEAVALSIPIIEEAVAKLNAERTRILLYFKSNSDEAGKILKCSLATNLPKYMLPSECIRVSAFEYTSNGKIDRYNIPE